LQGVPSTTAPAGLHAAWARVDEQVVAYTLQASAGVEGVQVRPATQEALQVPALHTRPLPQVVPSTSLPPTAQVVTVSFSEQVFA